jgi:hypothetical protein
VPIAPVVKCGWEYSMKEVSMKEELGALIRLMGVAFAAVLIIEHFDLDDKMKTASLPLKYKMQDIAEATQKRVVADMMKK